MVSQSLLAQELLGYAVGGGALRLKLGQVQIPSGPHTTLRVTYALKSPRAKG